MSGLNLDYELTQHLLIPEHVIALRDEGVGPDLVFDRKLKGFVDFVFGYLTKYGKPPSITTINEEWEIPKEAPTVDLEYLAERLKRRYIRSQQKKILEQLVETTEPDEFVNALISRSHELWSRVAPERQVLTGDDYREMIEEFRTISDRKESGATIGFPEVDEHTGGIGKGHLCFVVARPKRYKSWILLNSFIEQRIQGLTPILYTLELSEKDMYKRLMCLVSGVSYTRMIHNSLMPTDWKKIEEAMEEFAKLGPYYIVHPDFESRKVSNFVLEAQKRGANSILVDQLSFVHAEKPGRSDEQTKEIVHSMKVAATKMQIPLICACQFNREAAALEELAGADKIGLSRSIEETADLLIALFRNEEEAELNMIRMKILEGRYCKSNASWSIKINLSNKTAFTYNGQIIQRTTE